MTSLSRFTRRSTPYIGLQHFQLRVGRPCLGGPGARGKAEERPEGERGADLISSAAITAVLQRLVSARVLAQGRVRRRGGSRPRTPRAVSPARPRRWLATSSLTPTHPRPPRRPQGRRKRLGERRRPRRRLARAKSACRAPSFCESEAAICIFHS